MISDEARAALELLETDGQLSAADVVQAAKPQDSPLHPYVYAKPDEAIIAAYHAKTDDDVVVSYRITQAESLIRRYQVVVQRSTATGEHRDLLVRGYASARHIGHPQAPPGTYRRVTELTQVERAVLISRLAREFSSLRTRFGGLPEYRAALAAELAWLDGLVPDEAAS